LAPFGLLIRPESHPAHSRDAFERDSFSIFLGKVVETPKGAQEGGLGSKRKGRHLELLGFIVFCMSLCRS